MDTTDNAAQQQSAAAKAGLIYGLEDRPPLRETLFAAAQHLLAIFVAIVTPPLIIAGALGLDQETTSFLVSMSLMVSGVPPSFSVVALAALVVVCSASKAPVSLLSVLSLRLV